MVWEVLTTINRKTRQRPTNETIGGGREEKRSRQWEPQVQNLRGGNILDIFQKVRRAAHLRHRKRGEENQMNLQGRQDQVSRVLLGIEGLQYKVES